MSTQAWAAQSRQQAAQYIQSLKAAGYDNVVIVGPGTSVQMQPASNANWLVVGTRSKVTILP